MGPLARLNVAKFAGTARADHELREFKQRGAGPVCESFHYHLARVIEMLHCVERIEELMADADLFSEHIQAKASLNSREGIGSCEAPARHAVSSLLGGRQRADDHGQSTDRDGAEQSRHESSRGSDRPALSEFGSDGAALDESFLNRLEAAIRCFDPCLSCSTHALGQMPLQVELLAPGGDVLQRLSRDS